MLIVYILLKRFAGIKKIPNFIRRTVFSVLNGRELDKFCVQVDKLLEVGDKKFKPADTIEQIQAQEKFIKGNMSST